MTPQQIAQWASIVQTLVTMGVNVISSLRNIIGQAHPTLTPDQLNAAYVAILTDDALREAWAEKASQA